MSQTNQSYLLIYKFWDSKKLKCFGSVRKYQIICIKATLRVVKYTT